MAEENRPEPWKGSDGNQSWQTGHIENETADSRAEAPNQQESAERSEPVKQDGAGPSLSRKRFRPITQPTRWI